jgi:uncharacterized membrane protein YccC
MSTDASIYKALEGLESNKRQIDPKKSPMVWNQNQALIAICKTLEQLSRDAENTSNQTAAILRKIEGH